MYAVIETGGKQFESRARATWSRWIRWPVDVGSEVEFGRVLAVMNDSNELVTGSGGRECARQGHHPSTGAATK